jgi:hypothetical protein
MDWRRPLNRPVIRVARFAGMAAGGLIVAVAAFVVVLPLLGRAFMRSIEVLVAASVWFATSIGVGLSVWDVLGTIGRALAGGFSTPTASMLLGVLVLVGILALYWLQRLLESEEESSQ